jgi:antitoxin component YwqK of YwqJK toxin-antitoxin module
MIKIKTEMKKIGLIIMIAALFTACASDGQKKKEEEKGNTISDKEVVMSKFANGVPQVTWEYDEVDGKREVVYQREYNEDGTLFKEGPMKNRRREGDWKSYYRDGTLWSENNYKNGLIDGKTITYFPNGKKRYEGYFKNASKTGVWKFWNEQGEFVKEMDMDKKE